MYYIPTARDNQGDRPFFAGRINERAPGIWTRTGIIAGVGAGADAGPWAQGAGAGVGAGAGTGRAGADAGAQARGRRRGRGHRHRRGRGRGAQAQARARALGAGVGAGTRAQARGTGAGCGHRARAQGAKCGRGGAGCGHGAAGTGCGRWAQAGIRCAKSKGNLRRIAYRRAHNGFRAHGRVKYGGTSTLGTTGAVAVQHRLRRNRRTAAGIGCRSFDVIAICGSLLWDNPRRARTHTNSILFHAGTFESIAWRRRPPRPASPRLR